MNVARFAEKTKALSFFLELEPTVLYRLAALPDEIAATLTRDTPLAIGRGGMGTGDAVQKSPGGKEQQPAAAQPTVQEAPAGADVRTLTA